ncbi:insulinase family protein [Anaerotignum lactatifermentans]|uniref:Insulinase family protein n=1 Tax=Anaerotignum lactatifermentans TaxID=160404 RepID=A0ABS2G993_9FIRM|nr:pitrilysin family protein [Anaerotignum lactatifermentans]MBM6829712.1 insulinase family protein [Anaerotignum lactatifermentans]MBM6877133.1 insulinase family protein [Anaerotignum lactatifermentans]MBM6951371.1 insulinase family protein [Anaerotignum lactatifermentans]
MRYTDKVVGETILRDRTAAGMDCYYYPKKGCREKFAAVTVDFGAQMLSFLPEGETKAEHFLPGTAHFLEHKLFQQPWGDAFSRLQQNGAEANAFTDGRKTVYYFSCRERFYENLEILLDFVSTPYFPEEDVKKERAVIKSEIAMYDDLPQWAGYYQMLEMMYEHHPVKYPIAGKAQSVDQIDSSMLYRAYEVAYTPSRLSLVCAGGIHPKQIQEMAEGMKGGGCRGSFVFAREPEVICERYRERHMDQTVPYVHVGWKWKPWSFLPEDRLVMELLLDAWAGPGSEFWRKADAGGKMDMPPGRLCEWGEGYGFCAFSGACLQPEELAEGLMAAWKNLAHGGLSEDMFQRLKKKQIGRMIRLFSTAESAALAQVDWLPWKVDLGQALRMAKGLRREQAEKMLQNTISEDKMVLSVIR